MGWRSTRRSTGCSSGCWPPTTEGLPISGLYDQIGRAYAGQRRTEPRLARVIWDALDGARTVLNVGAGTGSYEPPDREVVAVEPSAVMRAQRPAGAAPCIVAQAEALPFDDLAFDAAMAVLSDHHWRDPIGGLREMARVARRVVAFQFDGARSGDFWLVRDYLPEFLELGGGQPALRQRAAAIGATLGRSRSHGIASTVSFTRNGAAPAHTSRSPSGAGRRSGRGSDPTPSGAPSPGSALTSSRAHGRAQPRPPGPRRRRSRRAPLVAAT